MKIHIYILIAMLSFNALRAGAWQWAHGFGSPGMERSWDMAVDYERSDIYVSGEFTDSLNVNGATYHGNGLSDCYIIKYNDSGQVQWVKTFGSTEGDVCLSISVDGSGNCYFTGYFIGTINIDAWQINGNGMWDVFYGKLNPDGNLLWLKSFGGTLNDIGYGIAATVSGDIFITGWFADSIILDPTINISSYGGSDIYLAKFDTNGNPLWARHAGTIGVEYGYKVDVSLSGDAYITGVTSPGSMFDNLTTDASGMFVAKYNSEGTAQWVLPSYGAGVNNISVSQSNALAQNSMVIGRVTETGIIGGTIINSVNDSDDIYMATFNSSGQWTDVQHYGGPGSDKGRAVDVRDGYVALSSFEQTVDFGFNFLVSNGESDIAVNMPDTSALYAGGSNSDVGTDIKYLSDGRFVVTGWFSGIMMFGSLLINSGHDTNLNAFVALYDPNITSSEDDLTAQLLQISCYPNPGSSMFDFKAISTEKLSIYNVRGQLVRSLEPTQTLHGSSSYRWDALDGSFRRCPSGIYIIRTNTMSSRLILINK